MLVTVTLNCHMLKQFNKLIIFTNVSTASIFISFLIVLALEEPPKMKNKFVDCFMLMNTALSLRNGHKLPESERPFIQEVFTTFVNISLTVQEIHFINAKSMEFKVTTLLNQHWVDPRLGANERTRKMAVKGQIWRPKIVNVNGENSICNQDDTVFWRGFGDEGNVLLSEKYILNSICTKNLQKFPFDTQICELKFGSFRFPAEEVELRWNSNPVEIFADADLLEFKLFNVTTYSFVEIRPTGNFSILAVQFIVARNSFHYIICSAIPSIFCAILSYIMFWISLNKRKLRLNVNIVCFCILFYLFYVSACLIQPVPFFKVLDLFLLVNVLFLFASIIETTVVDKICDVEESEFHLSKSALDCEYSEIIYRLEITIKIVFPILYCLFLLIFYVVYL